MLFTKLRGFTGKTALDLLKTAILLAAATLTGFLFRRIGFPETNTVILYLLAVILTARLSDSYAYGIISSVISIFAYNYFFTSPYYTFAVDNPSYIITFSVMTITALITSTLTYHAKKNAEEAREKEAETKALYTLTNHLTDAKDICGIASISADIISVVIGCNVAFLCFDENENPESSFFLKVFSGELRKCDTANAARLRQKAKEATGGYFTDSEYTDWIIYGRESILGLLRIPAGSAESITDAQTRLLRSMTESIALAMDRLRSAEQRTKSEAETMRERYRGNMLRAISHDLRTPLTGIMGTAEILMDMSSETDPRYRLAEEIHENADWLHSLVENILSLTRLQDGKLILNKQFEAVEEIVAGAVHHILQRSPNQEINIDIPQELLLVPMDAKLIQQVLINLLDNAICHSSENNAIDIIVRKSTKTASAVFTVADRGNGINEADASRIFEMFYTTRTKREDVQHVNGLGLAICEAIVKAHGGRIEARNRSDGKGAEFIFYLPLEDKNNERA